MIMKKITITNAYTWFNKGDAGILLGIVESLKQIYHNDVTFDILSFTPEEDKTYYCKDSSIKKVHSNVLNPHPYKHTKLGKIIAVLKLICFMIYQFLFINCFPKILTKKYDNYKSLSEADYIVVCGGGFLGGRKFDSFIHLFQIYINTKMQKKVIMMGTSIEPVTNWFIKKITNYVLKKVDYIYAREVITFNYLKEFLAPNKFTLIPDMAFMLQDDYSKHDVISNLKKKYKMICGITVRKWFFPGESDSKKLFENYKNEIKCFMETVIRTKNICFVFVPQVIVEHGNDIDVAKEIKALLSKEFRENFIILEDDFHPIEIKNLIANMNYFIGTRMHSNIFAISMCIPTIAIAYEKKTNGIMHTAHLDDYVLEMNSITSDNLLKKMRLVEENYYFIQKSLSQTIKAIRKEILHKLTDVLKEL